MRLQTENSLNVILTLTEEEAGLLYRVCDVITWDGRSKLARFAEEVADLIAEEGIDTNVVSDAHSGEVEVEADDDYEEDDSDY